MAKKDRKTSRIIFFLLFAALIFISLSINSKEVNNTIAVSNVAEIVEIGDRYTIVNWTKPENRTFNSYSLKVENCNDNATSTWSVITLNATHLPSSSEKNLVNFTDSQKNCYPALKQFSTNFSYFTIFENHITVQAKITGLVPETTYIIKIYLANITIIEENGQSKLILNSEEISWSSEKFSTLPSINENLEYSKNTTLLSLLIISLLFLAFFIILAKIDVPFNKTAYVFIFPALFGLALFEIYPILYGFFLSFTSYHLKRGEIPKITWFQNYIHISQNPQLPIAFTTSLVWSTIIIIFKIVLGFSLAYLLHYKVKRKKLWYLCLYLPWVIPSYIKILSWRAFFQGSAGESLFNHLFGTNINLVSQPYTALFIACFVEIWDSLPLITTLFLGALTSIPRELRDIAQVNQIPEGRYVRKVIIPLVKPIILPAIILEIIKTFGSFNVVFLLTDGHPLLPYGSSESGVIGATDLFSTFTFYMFYHRHDVGIAAAYSTIMSLITLFFVLIWIKMSRSTENVYRLQKSNQHRQRFVIPILLSLQCLGYIIAQILSFRYFGYYWSSHLSYIMAGFFAITAIISFIRPPKNGVLILKLLLALDLILSFVQFYIFEMWYAFNWNIFIVVAEFFILSDKMVEQKQYKDHEMKILIWLNTLGKNLITKIQKTTQFIDDKLADISSVHLILLLEFLTLLTSNYILHQKSLMSYFTIITVGLILIASVFSNKCTLLSIISQPILWLGISFSWHFIGWKILLILISIMYLASYHNLFSAKYPYIKRFLSFRFITNSSLILFIASFIAFIPMWNILWVAFSPVESLVPTSLFPKNPSIENFKLLFTEEKIYVYFANSLIIALGSALICVLVTTLAAYSFSRYSFKGKKQILIGIFVLKMFTGILTLIPLYLILYNIGLIDTYFGVILAYSMHTIPLGLWLLKGYLDSIPRELDETASLMGNSYFRILYKVILPLALPAIIIVFLLNFLAAWNGFLLSFVILQSPSKYTLSIKLYTFIGPLESIFPKWGMFAASSLLVIVPLLLVFLFLKDHLVRGLDNIILEGDI
ncbi:MAG: ABC transporter permease subunit [Candidatus Heimdallarchaeaceae archaeon]